MKRAKDRRAGELCVRGSSLALGYWNNPEKTASVFVQNPLNPHYPELIHRTGDLVSRNARGEILFIGRKDFQIKHLGYRIELGEDRACRLPGGMASVMVVSFITRLSKEIVLFFESASPPVAGLHSRTHAGPRSQIHFADVVSAAGTILLMANGKYDRQKLTEVSLPN